MTENPPPYQADADETARLKGLLMERLGAAAVYLPNSMAALLRDYSRLEGLISDAQLADHLSVSADALHRLRLCRRPNSASPAFSDEVRQIAAHVRMEPGVLARVVRLVEGVDSLHNVNQSVSIHSTVSRGQLMAARDHIEEWRPSRVRDAGAGYRKAKLDAAAAPPSAQAAPQPPAPAAPQPPAKSADAPKPDEEVEPPAV